MILKTEHLDSSSIPQDIIDKFQAKWPHGISTTKQNLALIRKEIDRKIIDFLPNLIPEEKLKKFNSECYISEYQFDQRSTIINRYSLDACAASHKLFSELGNKFKNLDNELSLRETVLMLKSRSYNIQEEELIEALEEALD